MKLFNIGHKLPNGAVVLKSDYNSDTGKSVVLAEWEHSSWTPYVTWRTDHTGQCFYGHYFDIWDEASKDFDERVAGWVR